MSVLMQVQHCTHAHTQSNQACHLAWPTNQIYTRVQTLRATDEQDATDLSDTEAYLHGKTNYVFDTCFDRNTIQLKKQFSKLKCDVFYPAINSQFNAFEAKDFLNNILVIKTVPQRKHITIIKVNRVLLFKETMPVYTENHTEPTRVRCRLC
jgi:hypothetical protein